MNGEERKDPPEEPGQDRQHDPDDPVKEAFKAFWVWIRTEDKERLAIIINAALVVVGILAASVYFFQLLVMQHSITVNKDIAHAEQRAWVGIADATPVAYEAETATQRSVNLIVAFRLRNYGHSAAQHVKFLAVLESDPSVTSLSCDEVAKIHAGDLILPTQEHTLNWAMNLTRAQMEAGWKHQNPQLGQVLFLRIMGCIEYSDRENEAPHRTPFAYMVFRKGGFIKPDSSFPIEQLVIDRDFVNSEQTR